MFSCKVVGFICVLGFKISNLQLTNQNAGFVTAMQLHILNTSHITVA